MAFAVTNLAHEYAPIQIGIPLPSNAATGGPSDASASEADLTVAAAGTTTSAIKNMGSALKSFKALVYMKTSAGTSTISVYLEVSSSATFASDIRVLDARHVNANVAANTNEFLMSGVTALIAGAQYVRIRFVTGAGTSGTADLVYYAS